MQTAAVRTQTRFENILYATDFSTAAEHAVPYVKNIAKHYESKVVALHVRPPIVNPMTQPGTWAIDIEAAKATDEDNRRKLETMLAGVPANALIVEGDVQSSVQQAIEDNHIDLLVMGTRGRTGIGKFFLGSIAEELLRHVPCPVLTIGPHADPSLGAHGVFREVLYATDFSPESQRAAKYALSLAQEFEARLVLLHVVPNPEDGNLVSWSDVETSSKQLLRNLVPMEAEAWCKPEYFVVRGKPAEQILNLANLRESNLIVLGTQAERGLPGAATHLPFAIAHKVVSRALCPVLTVRH